MKKKKMLVGAIVMTILTVVFVMPLLVIGYATALGHHFSNDQLNAAWFVALFGSVPAIAALILWSQV